MREGGLARVQVLLLVAVLVAASLSAGALLKFGRQRGESGPVVVQDLLGREVTVPENLTSVAAIGPGALRLLCYLGATDLLAGVEESERSWGLTGRDYAMAHGRLFENLPVVGPGGPGRPPAPELLLAARPQLILMSPTYAEMYDPDRLQAETGAAVMVTGYTTSMAVSEVEGLENMLLTLGRALRREKRAEELVGFIEGVRSDLRNRLKGITSYPKFYIGATSYKGAQPFTTSVTPHLSVSLLGIRSLADNVATGTPPSVSFEYLLQQQPEVVFIDEGNLATVRQDFQKDPAKYRQLRAFQTGSVYGLLPYNYYATNFTVAMADAYYLGKVLFPERFEDVDPAAKADEIFRAFLGCPLYSRYENAYGGFIPLSGFFPPS
jgi:iron complex transport system substrate-binding protein